MYPGRCWHVILKMSLQTEALGVSYEEWSSDRRPWVMSHYTLWITIQISHLTGWPWFSEHQCLPPCHTEQLFLLLPPGCCRCSPPARLCGVGCSVWEDPQLETLVVMLWWNLRVHLRGAAPAELWQSSVSQPFQTIPSVGWIILV